MTEVEAWEFLASEFEDCSEHGWAHTCDAGCLCNAIIQLKRDEKIDTAMVSTLLQPIKALPGYLWQNYYWPRSKAGAASRVAFCREQVARLQVKEASV